MNLKLTYILAPDWPQGKGCWIVYDIERHPNPTSQGDGVSIHDTFESAKATLRRLKEIHRQCS